VIGNKTNVIKYIYIHKSELGLCDLEKISNCDFSDILLILQLLFICTLNL